MTDESQLLLKACHPGLYRSNAFRLLGLSVDAPARDVNRQRDKILMAQKLGGEAGSVGLLAVRPAPAEDDLRLAAESLHDPASRLVQELFWFWPSQTGQAAADPALQALKAGEVDDARYLWLGAERPNGGPPDAAGVARHNLAVIAHFTALENEPVTSSPNTPLGDVVLADEVWSRALKRWLTLTRDDSFWSRLAERIRRLEDPQLTDATAARLRQALGPAVLSINAGLAIEASEAGKKAVAARHIKLIQQSGFAAEVVEEALRRAAEPVVERIKSLCGRSDADARGSAASAIAVADRLLRETQPNLATIDLLIAPGNATRDAVHDEVVTAALHCQVLFGGTLSEQTIDRKVAGWQACLEQLGRLRQLAASETSQTRMEENATPVRMNLIASLLQQTDAAVAADPDHAHQAVEKLLADTRPALAQIPKSHANYAEIHDIVAERALSCQIANGNKTKDWDTSVRLLQQIKDVARGETMRAQVQKNLTIVKENLIDRWCQQTDADAQRNPGQALEVADLLLEKALLVLPVSPDKYGQRMAHPNLGGAAPAYLPPVMPSAQPAPPDIHDVLAMCVLNCSIIYGNRTKDWNSILILLREVQPVAATQAVWDRIAQNIKIVTDNMRYTPAAPYPQGSPPYAPYGAPAYGAPTYGAPSYVPPAPKGQFRFPERCCRCAKPHQGAKPVDWPISTLLSGGYRIVRKVSINVPICKACHNQLLMFQHGRTIGVFAIAFGIFFGLLHYPLFAILARLGPLAWLTDMSSVTAIISGGVIVALGIAMSSYCQNKETPFAGFTWNGDDLYFTNAEYLHEFKLLNGR